MPHLLNKSYGWTIIEWFGLKGDNCEWMDVPPGTLSSAGIPGYNDFRYGHDRVTPRTMTSVSPSIGVKELLLKSGCYNAVENQKDWSISAVEFCF